jgi:hypothetical protein
MATARTFFLKDADDGLPIEDGQQALDRDLEFSTMLHFVGWGEFPDQYEHGIWATTPDGTPVPRPKAVMPEDHPIHVTSTGRVLEGERRQTELDKREGASSWLRKNGITVPETIPRTPALKPYFAHLNPFQCASSILQKCPLGDFCAK